MTNFFLIKVMIAGIALNIACHSRSNINRLTHTANDSNVSIVANDKRIKDTVPPKIKESSLETAGNIEVLSISKEIKGNGSGEDNSDCMAWSLTAKQIELIIRKFEPLTSEEQYLSYSIYPCRVSGEIRIDEIKYKYWIGAGGTLTLKNADTTLYFGCPDINAEEYFISGKLTKEELNQ